MARLVAVALEMIPKLLSSSCTLNSASNDLRVHAPEGPSHVENLLE